MAKRKPSGDPTFSVRMPEPLIKLIDNHAGEGSRGDFIRRACYAYLDRMKPGRYNRAQMADEAIKALDLLVFGCEQGMSDQTRQSVVVRAALDKARAVIAKAKAFEEGKAVKNGRRKMLAGDL